MRRGRHWNSPGRSDLGDVLVRPRGGRSIVVAGTYTVNATYGGPGGTGSATTTFMYVGTGSGSSVITVTLTTTTTSTTTVGVQTVTYHNHCPQQRCGVTSLQYRHRSASITNHARHDHEQPQHHLQRHNWNPILHHQLYERLRRTRRGASSDHHPLEQRQQRWDLRPRCCSTRSNHSSPRTSNISKKAVLS